MTHHDVVSLATNVALAERGLMIGALALVSALVGSSAHASEEPGDSVAELAADLLPASERARWEASRSVTTAAVSTGSRTSWVSQNWRIPGISYAEVKTTVNYKYRGARATAINSCNGIVHNYVPLRSIDKYNTESVNSDGSVTCRTIVSLKRPLQKTVEGAQGLRVNGNGEFIRRWDL